jgi:hypothetical protein
VGGLLIITTPLVAILAQEEKLVKAKPLPPTPTV